ncbi:MAG TPA: isocitrate lyase/phosphoenolpyruvate mutase family protein [Deltaproteobacteria bacterium]|jgi:2-methylisocitrate lyase-like PEP mutase family enzyme|nr:isocitrate lyase/phosphoenolpyruvate mutase family protein [Deltaproteobacteria bacterium]
MRKSDCARAFHALHEAGLLILPNAWDAGSARIIEHAGARAIATSSAAVAWSYGYPDGEAMPRDAVLSAVRAIVRVVDIPVSVDLEGGYASDAQAAAEFAARIIDAGAVGMNVEDGTGPPEALAGKIEEIRKSAARAGVELWVNARIDVYLRRLKEGEAAYQEAVSRARRYREAGANSIFVPAASGEALIARLVEGVVLPLNVLAWPGVPPAERLKELGVRRLSAGSGIAKVVLNRVHAMTQAFLADGRSDPFGEGSLGNPELNRMMRRSESTLRS